MYLQYMSRGQWGHINMKRIKIKKQKIKDMKNLKALIIALIVIVNYSFAGDGKLNIICSFSDYATIVEAIAKDKAIVKYIASGEQDPHFVAPKPSYAMMLNKADMWVTTGLDLEVWSTTLIDKARNNEVNLNLTTVKLMVQ